MSFCQLMFPEVRSSLELGFGLKPPASSYWSYFYSSFKTSPSMPLALPCFFACNSAVAGGVVILTCHCNISCQSSLVLHLVNLNSDDK